MGTVTCRRARNAVLDVLELLNIGEPILSERRDDQVLIVQTDRRTVGIGPDGTFSVLSGRDFRYSPAVPVIDASAKEPTATPAPPAGDVNA
jgi:hypothetical protein